tara:strand:- start:2833 stop:3054 length:222 start_codon:yes stop_codon:yes gene_type:complete
VVKSVDRENGRIILAHDLVPMLKWPSMTMGFAAEDRALLESVNPDEKVSFTFINTEGETFVTTQFSKSSRNAC